MEEDFHYIPKLRLHKRVLMLILGIKIPKIPLNRTMGALPPACPQPIVRPFSLYMSFIQYESHTTIWWAVHSIMG